MKPQRDESGMGRASMVPRTESGSKERGVAPTASELEAVSTPRKENVEGKSSRKSRVVNGCALDE